MPAACIPCVAMSVAVALIALSVVSVVVTAQDMSVLHVST